MLHANQVCCSVYRAAEDGAAAAGGSEQAGPAQPTAAAAGQQQPSPVTCVAWSRDGRHLAAGAADGGVTLWDVLTGQCVFHVQLAGGMASLCITPRPPYKLLASLAAAPPALVDASNGEVHPLLPISLGECNRCCQSAR